MLVDTTSGLQWFGQHNVNTVLDPSSFYVPARILTMDQERPNKRYNLGTSKEEWVTGVSQS